jgi:hypothetical protein
LDAKIEKFRQKIDDRHRGVASLENQPVGRTKTALSGDEKDGAEIKGNLSFWEIDVTKPTI